MATNSFCSSRRAGGPLAAERELGRLAEVERVVDVASDRTAAARTAAARWRGSVSTTFTAPKKSRSASVGVPAHTPGAVRQQRSAPNAPAARALRIDRQGVGSQNPRYESPRPPTKLFRGGRYRRGGEAVRRRRRRAPDGTGRRTADRHSAAVATSAASAPSRRSSSARSTVRDAADGQHRAVPAPGPAPGQHLRTCREAAANVSPPTMSARSRPLPSNAALPRSSTTRRWKPFTSMKPPTHGASLVAVSCRSRGV